MSGQGDGGDAPPRKTYMPKPPSKEEVDQVSREQALVTDDWTGEAPAASPEEQVPDGDRPRGKDEGG